MSRRLRAILAALLLAFAAVALRLWVMERTFPVRPLGDEMYYVVVAANLADGYGHVYGADARALRPPAHSWLLSNFSDAGALMARPQDSPPRRLGVRLDQLRPLLRVEVVLGTALVLVTSLLGWALFDARTGFAAGCTGCTVTTPDVPAFDPGPAWLGRFVQSMLYALVEPDAVVLASTDVADQLFGCSVTRLSRAGIESRKPVVIPRSGCVSIRTPLALGRVSLPDA